MNYSGGAFDAVQKLYKKGMLFGTDTTRQILERLGLPERRLKIIHVAGTNGKGSVCEYLTQILIAAGKSVGTMQSPAVYDYGEQFRINGNPCPEALLEKSFGSALSAAEDLNASGFEVEVAGALLAFKDYGCEYAVIECGMGGKDDATNAISKKELAIITSVGLEHTRYLGHTPGVIAKNKAQIIKNCPAVISSLQPDEVKEYFSGKSVIFVGQPQNTECFGLDGQRFDYGGKTFETAMLGCAQPYNAATAIEAARLLKMDETAIYSGVKAAKLKGRLEVLRTESVTYILDGAHNPASFLPLTDILQRFFKPNETAIVFGCLSDKDVEGNVCALRGLAEKIIAVRPDNPRGMDINKIYAACSKYFSNAAKSESAQSALSEIGDKFKNVVVCGTFTILREAKQWIEKRL
ncbi:MAG: hypothetical protein HDP34_05260 [Clostridia bacterium]|nr:hypothetical protein [Clostridia bacterium]